jgi:hypothetical protein
LADALSPIPNRPSNWQWRWKIKNATTIKSVAPPYKQRRAGAHDMLAMPGNGSNQQQQAGWQADDAGIEDSHIGKAILVGVIPVLDWRNEAPPPEQEHRRCDYEKDNAQPRRCGDSRLIHSAGFLVRCGGSRPI